MALGADVGGSRIKFARLHDGELTLQHQVERENDWPDQLERELVALANPDEPVGVGVAGLVDHERGVLHWAPHLSGRDIRLGEKLSATLARPVMIDNDANCATRAEARHLDRDPVLVLMIGTGIGMGLWTAGDVYRGAAHAGEAGHMPIENDGLGCRCGRRGCWETRVSGWRFAEVRATEGALEEMGVWLGRGLLTLATLFDPALIVLGGGFIEEHGNTLQDLASDEFSRLSDVERPPSPIVRAVHGSVGGCHRGGDALLALAVRTLILLSMEGDSSFTTTGSSSSVRPDEVIPPHGGAAVQLRVLARDSVLMLPNLVKLLARLVKRISVRTLRRGEHRRPDGTRPHSMDSADDRRRRTFDIAQTAELIGGEILKRVAVLLDEPAPEHDQSRIEQSGQCQETATQPHSHFLEGAFGSSHFRKAPSRRPCLPAPSATAATSEAIVLDRHVTGLPGVGGTADRHPRPSIDPCRSRSRS